MASKELIEKVARNIATLNDGTDDDWECYYADAQAACSAILAALQEPTEGMIKSGQSFYNGTKPFQIKLWRAMLNASPLGEQSE